MSDWETARINMVESQIRPNAVTDRRLIAALSSVPRERFVPAERRALAYGDTDVALSESGEGGARRFLIAPMQFARMVQVACVAVSDHVLDVGCASGYSSAVIAGVAGSVVALEEDPRLAALAQERLSEIGADNVAVEQGPLAEGFASQGPFDVIILEGAVDSVPQALFEQLGQGGRLIAALPVRGVARVHRYVKAGTAIGGAPAFDAQLPPLPGFQREASFTF
jgi:protein-L-isoaspartate(D-aspartate) O-methyltransferase